MQLTLHIHSLPIGAFAARTGTEMPKPDPWDSHGKQVSGTPKTSTPSYSADLRLECGFNPHHHTAWYPCTNPQTGKPVCSNTGGQELKESAPPQCTHGPHFYAFFAFIAFIAFLGAGSAAAFAAFFAIL